MFLFVCRGAIRFFTEPPEIASSTTSAAIVTTMAEPFSLDNFVSTNDQEMQDEEDNSKDDDKNEDEEMSDDEEDEKRMKSSLKTPTSSLKHPSPRLTRSQAKAKGVTFSIDTKGTELLRKRKSVKRQQLEEEAISPTAQRKLGLVATKKTGLIKKIQKSKKKSAKKADELSEIVQNMTF